MATTALRICTEIENFKLRACIQVLDYMESLIPIQTLKTPYKETSRDERLRITTLYFNASWTQVDIAL